MENTQEESKPEGFKREFRYNAWFILGIGTLVMIAVALIIKFVYFQG